MKTGTISHKHIQPIYYQDNFPDTSPLSIKTHLLNEVSTNIEDKNLFIYIDWTLSVYLNESNEKSFEYLGQSIVPLISVTDFDSDLPALTLVVMNSCNAFLDQIKSIFGSSPLIDPNFSEIAYRIIESLINSGEY